jgi:hypothetical protein
VALETPANFATSAIVGAQPVRCINSTPLSKSNLKVADFTPSGLSGESGVGVVGRVFIRVNQ